MALGKKQLEELRKGPQWQLGDSPAEYPPLPDATQEDPCYLLAWPLHDISERLMTIAGCEVEHHDEPGFEEALLKAIVRIWFWGDYHHSWLAALHKDGLESRKPTDPAINDVEEETWFLAISCSEENVKNEIDRRPSRAQFEWYKKVLGKDPSWVLIDRDLYKMAMKQAVWKRAPCCPGWGEGTSHLVDLGTMRWKRGQE